MYECLAGLLVGFCARELIRSPQTLRKIKDKMKKGRKQKLKAIREREGELWHAAKARADRAVEKASEELTAIQERRQELRHAARARADRAVEKASEERARIKRRIIACLKPSEQKAASRKPGKVGLLDGLMNTFRNARTQVLDKVKQGRRKARMLCR
jgi:hypothetical protein